MCTVFDFSFELIDSSAWFLHSMRKVFNTCSFLCACESWFYIFLKLSVTILISIKPQYLIEPWHLLIPLGIHLILLAHYSHQHNYINTKQQNVSKTNFKTSRYFWVAMNLYKYIISLEIIIIYNYTFINYFMYLPPSPDNKPFPSSFSPFFLFSKSLVLG